MREVLAKRSDFRKAKFGVERFCTQKTDAVLVWKVVVKIFELFRAES